MIQGRSLYIVPLSFREAPFLADRPVDHGQGVLQVELLDHVRVPVGYLVADSLQDRRRVTERLGRELRGPREAELLVGLDVLLREPGARAGLGFLRQRREAGTLTLLP